jgi:hypothetical protein
MKKSIVAAVVFALGHYALIWASAVAVFLIYFDGGAKEHADAKVQSILGLGVKYFGLPDSSVGWLLNSMLYGIVFGIVYGVACFLHRVKK